MRALLCGFLILGVLLLPHACGKPMSKEDCFRELTEFAVRYEKVGEVFTDEDADKVETLGDALTDYGLEIWPDIKREMANSDLELFKLTLIAVLVTLIKENLDNPASTEIGEYLLTSIGTDIDSHPMVSAMSGGIYALDARAVPMLVRHLRSDNYVTRNWAGSFLVDITEMYELRFDGEQDSTVIEQKVLSLERWFDSKRDSIIRSFK